jgi:hypothetical protein
VILGGAYAPAVRKGAFDGARISTACATEQG